VSGVTCCTPPSHKYPHLGKMASNMSSIYFQNVCGLSRHKDTLRTIASIQVHDLLLLCETHLKSDLDLPFLSNSFSCLFNNQSSQSGGLAIFARKHISIKRLEQLEFQQNPYVIAALVRSTATVKPIVILCCYISPTIAKTSAPLACEPIIKSVALAKSYCTVNGSDLYMIGDFNAHNPAWGCSGLNPSGSIIYNMIDTHNFHILNCIFQQPAKPTRLRSGTVIDLALCSSHNSVQNFDVVSPLFMSDHESIQLTLNDHPQSGPLENFSFETWDWKNADALAYETFLQVPLLQWFSKAKGLFSSAKTGLLDHQQTIDKLWKTLADLITAAAEIVVGKKNSFQVNKKLGHSKRGFT
jgi:hypothetical protein